MKLSQIVLLVMAIAAGGAAAAGQNGPPSAPAAAPAAPMHMSHTIPMAQPTAQPLEPGQAAFGAIQEIVRMLLTDPNTDWSKVKIDALRQHLIDMDEVTMRADARCEQLPNGLRILVTGSGRTLPAIQRMIPEHAMDINGLYGWAVRAQPIPNGEAMTVTASNAADVQKIRALGFMGIMVLGTHQMHHLAMANGEPMDMHRMH
jgi:hypothetical protein